MEESLNLERTNLDYCWKQTNKMNELNLKMAVVGTLKLYRTRLGVIVMTMDGASWTQRLSGVIFLSSAAPAPLFQSTLQS